MSKKQDRTKLLFFSQSHIEGLENEIQTVIQLYRTGRLDYRNAQIRLHNGKEDIMSIYWHIACQLATAQQELRTIAHYQEINGERTDLNLSANYGEVKQPEFSPIMTQSNPIINQLMQGFQDFQDGKINFHQWEMVAMKCKELLKSENRSLQTEVRDILRKSKQYFQDQKDEIIREHQDRELTNDNEVDFEDMEIKKIEP